MKNLLLPLTSLVFVLFTACQPDDGELFENSQPQTLNLQEEIFAAQGRNTGHGSLRSCPSQKLLKQQMLKSPGFARKRAQLEAHTRSYVSKQRAKEKIKKEKKQKPFPNNGASSYTIPVYIHVIYSHEQENISEAQIQSQIDALNADFNALNTEMRDKIIPREFASAAGSTGINFRWSPTDISRKKSTRLAWGTSDEMKYSAKGGSDARYPGQYLNIWVCNLGGTNIGYAQYPGGDDATDGVAISPQYFGTIGYVQAPFDKGRTLTHEVGHWLNLYHIWGDGNCSVDDMVADTPLSDRPNYGCPTLPTKHCNTNDMYMNFMDYTDDACMYMFTKGQRDRMHALFASGGSRSSLVQ